MRCNRATPSLLLNAGALFLYYQNQPLSIRGSYSIHARISAIAASALLQAARPSLEAKGEGAKKLFDVAPFVIMGGVFAATGLSWRVNLLTTALFTMQHFYTYASLKDYQELHHSIAEQKRSLLLSAGVAALYWGCQKQSLAYSPAVLMRVAGIATSFFVQESLRSSLKSPDEPRALLKDSLAFIIIGGAFTLTKASWQVNLLATILLGTQHLYVHASACKKPELFPTLQLNSETPSISTEVLPEEDKQVNSGLLEASQLNDYKALISDLKNLLGLDEEASEDNVYEAIEEMQNERNIKSSLNEAGCFEQSEPAISAELEQATQQSEKFYREVSALKEELCQVREELATVLNESVLIKQENQKQKQKNKSLEKANKSLGQKCRSLMQELNVAKGELEDKKETHRILLDSNRDYENEIESLRNKVSQLETDNGKLRKAVDLRNKADNKFEKENQDLNIKIEELTNELQRKNSINLGLERTNEEFKAWVSNQSPSRNSFSVGLSPVRQSFGIRKETGNPRCLFAQPLATGK